MEIAYRIPVICFYRYTAKKIDRLCELRFGVVPERAWIVMELCEGDSLRQALDDAAQTLSWELRTRWLLQIAEGMAELHSLL